MPKAATGMQVVETHSKTTKLQTLIELLRRPDGALLDELVSTTSWQKHSVRGAISGALKKKHKLHISSTLIEGRGRVYRVEKSEVLKAARIATADENDLWVQS